MKITVVIAAYNELDTIHALTTRLVAALDEMDAASWKLIYVIDGTDGTVEIARKFAAERSQIQVIHNQQPSGLGRAFLRGFQEIPDDTDYVVTMDADLNHQPEEIPKLLATSERAHADIVVGSRRIQQSTVEGVPLWKSALSQTVNRMMHILMGTRINDLTSGFRVYRASSLRRIEFENVGFAFLPEILIDAASKRMKVVEEPIRFVFREAGESKMHIAATSLSYVRLFATKSVGVTAWLTVTLLLLGIGVRIGFCFPQHKYESDADAVLGGLCALNVTHGQLPLFFPGGYRLSSQSCYVTAAMFSAFGPTRAALGATSVLYGTLFLIIMWLALCEAAGSRAAVWGLVLAAFPPLQFWLVAYPTWGYPEILACCACMLWLGFRLLRLHLLHPIRDAALFGLCVGFSFWTSPQTIMVSVPVILLVLWKKKFSLRSIIAASISALIPLFPYFLVIAYRGTTPFTSSFATRPASGTAAILSNAHYLFSYTLPVLFFSNTARQLLTFSLAVPRLIFVLTIFGALVLVTLGFHRHPTKHGLVPTLFPLLILAFGCLVYVSSGAGTIRGWTVRYAVPLWLTVPLSVSLTYRHLHRRRIKAILIICVCILAGLQLAEYPFLHPDVERGLVAGLAENRAILAWMRENHADVAIGNYWTVYALNFDSARSIVALPLTEFEDYFRFERALYDRPSAAALLDSDPIRLSHWATKSGLRGRIDRVTDHIFGLSCDRPLEFGEIQQTRMLGK